MCELIFWFQLNTKFLSCLLRLIMIRSLMLMIELCVCVFDVKFVTNNVSGLSPAFVARYKLTTTTTTTTAMATARLRN